MNPQMKLSDFDYDLPKKLIAQTPKQKRDHSKLLLLNLANDLIEHRTFHQISEILTSDDILVVNDTRVINARLFGHKTTGGKIELLILEPQLSNHTNNQIPETADCLVKGKVREGTELEIALQSKPKQKGHHIVKARIIKNISGGRFKVEFDSEIPMNEFLVKHGQLPLPPYIKKELNSPERYQTIYSTNLGSIAAPTAGLHFTSELLGNLKRKGIRIAYITLHINYGTFTPVRTEDITLHKMEREYAILTEKNAELINTAYSAGGRLVAVGTTTMRTLETIALNNSSTNKTVNQLKPCHGWTELFIYPGFKFKAGVDILITNFHLPRSTLLMLVSAFAGREPIFRAYHEAIEKKYRFYSLGDAMMIIK